MSTTGILALQGGFFKHQEMVEKLGEKTLLIKKPEQLEFCDRLIIPGGESTTLTKLFDIYDFREPLINFGKTRPVMGTCAGLILLSSKVEDSRVKQLNLIDIEAERNAYGSQVESFSADIYADFLKKEYKCIFIRAPKIKECSENVKILMSYEGNPIAVEQGRILALTFHPELTQDPSIHEYFLKL
ncbi:MAG: pyridoxal 5'-phosphate synthase glutaminase subunit PdxT [Spirochaetales bacterium]|nr:pyridoxal 5'-phosphate synthase glutaminase subunit PdxT [Spirochaetales bacterium]